jgi:hypothetical protein
VPTGTATATTRSGSAAALRRMFHAPWKRAEPTARTAAIAAPP